VVNPTNKYQILQLTGGSECVSQRRVVLHEMMHALGFLHEQSRPDRDNFVSVNESNIISGKEDQFKIQNFETFEKPYDYTSIMQYASKWFSKNGEHTIVAIADGTPNDFITNMMGKGNDLSPLDKDGIKRLYNCNGQCRQDIDCNKFFPEKPDPVGYVRRAICNKNICECAEGQVMHGFVCLDLNPTPPPPPTAAPGEAPLPLSCNTDPGYCFITNSSGNSSPGATVESTSPCIECTSITIRIDNKSLSTVCVQWTCTGPFALKLLVNSNSNSIRTATIPGGGNWRFAYPGDSLTTDGNVKMIFSAVSGANGFNVTNFKVSNC